MKGTLPGQDKESWDVVAAAPRESEERVTSHLCQSTGGGGKILDQGTKQKFQLLGERPAC